MKYDVTSGPVSDMDVDVLVVGVREGESGPEPVGPARAVDDALDGNLPSMLAALGATGAAGETTRLLTNGTLAASQLLAVGVADHDRLDARYQALREAAGCATRALAGRSTLGLALPVDTPASARAVVEGAILGAYSFETYRHTTKSSGAALRSLTVHVPESASAEWKSEVGRGATIAAAVRWARDLVNEPPQQLTPALFVDRVRPALVDAGVIVDLMTEAELRRDGYGGILGVGQGAHEPPLLLRAQWRAAGATKTLALVGKGVTFDSGGLSLKQPESMETMKIDMAGAAACVAAVSAIAQLGIGVNVTVWAPLVENMPSATAMRPGDVLRTYSGHTVEVLNTDAEGRLILADALTRASEDLPDLVVDVATLTGAAMNALGRRTAALMTNSSQARDMILAAAFEAGELLWPMPLAKELRRSLKSYTADMANKGDREGGMLVAGHFLNEFVPEDIPWGHLDIPGPAFNDRDPYGHVPRGGTGYGVATLVALAESMFKAAR